MRLADLREPATTGAAFGETGEEIIGSASAFRADASVLGHDTEARILLPLFNPVPEMVIDDP
jgi:hypothetical protein